MCTQPLTILNPKKWISPTHGQQLYLRVPCGHCVECRQQRQNEWQIRSYYECIDTILHDGYMLFDTLTYAPGYLPQIADFIDVPAELNFSCFRFDDIRLFFNRLRSYLKRRNYNVEENLRYFVTSEYGSDRVYNGRRATTRPHYHIFVFVRHNAVPPLVLSRAISHCWCYGRTDGVPYKTSSYVLQHNTFNSMDVATRRCVMYVAKYVSKDFEYTDLIKNRIYKIMCHHYPDFDWQMSKVQRGFYQMLLRFVNCDHRQSLYFGSFYIEAQGVENIVNNGYLKFNFNGLPLVYGLFPSLKRKLFYNYKKVDGDVTYYLNLRGILFKQKRINEKILSLQSEINQYNVNHQKSLECSAFDLLFNQYRLQPNLVMDEKAVRKQIVDECSVDCYNGLRNYSSIDRNFIHRSVFSKKDYGSKKHGFLTLEKIRYVNDPKKIDYGDCIELNQLENTSMCYDDQLECEYNKLLVWKKQLGEEKMAVERHKARLKKLYKSINLC